MELFFEFFCFYEVLKLRGPCEVFRSSPKFLGTRSAGPGIRQGYLSQDLNFIRKISNNIFIVPYLVRRFMQIASGLGKYVKFAVIASFLALFLLSSFNFSAGARVVRASTAASSSTVLSLGEVDTPPIA